MRTTRHSFGLAAALLALAAGCGSNSDRASGPPPPRLPRALAQDFARRADGIAARVDAGDNCGALQLASALQQRTVRLIGRVPPVYQETLQGTVNDIVARISCAPVPSTRGQPHTKPPGKAKGKSKGKRGKDD